MRILMLDLDTLRPDHLGCYGYHRNTTPTLDSIAADGVRFTNYYCSDAPCLPSRTALMSGRFGIHTGVVNHAGGAADLRVHPSTRDFKDIISSDSLPAFFRQQGMYTASISPFPERHSAWWFNAGFNEMHNTGKCGDETADEVLPVVMDWLEKNSEKDNWFLHVNFWDAHTPYRTPLDYGNPFENDPTPAWITEDILQEHLKSSIGPHSPWEVNMYNGTPQPRFPRQKAQVHTMEELKEFFDGYDVGIRYMDDHLGKIIQYLKDKGFYEDTVIIVTADHGEMMGEMGIYAEHGMADYITGRIPMIIKWPGCEKGSIDEALHYNLDLAPTMAELFNKPAKASWDGKSFAKVLTEGVSEGHEALILSQCAHVCQRGVRFGDYMYIRTYHDGYHLFPKEMLFNIKDDPYEQCDLADKERELCKTAAYYLMNWQEDNMHSIPYDVDPLWKVMKEGGPFHAKGHLEQYCQRLEETERGYAVPELKEKHPKEFTGELKFVR